MHLGTDLRQKETPNSLPGLMDTFKQSLNPCLLNILLTDVVPFMPPQDHMLAISPTMELVATRVDKKRQKHPDRGDSRYLSLHPGYMPI